MALDGLQASGTLTATTSAAISTTFSTAAGIQFRASFVSITAATSGGAIIDFSGATATTSAGYPLAAGEALKIPIGYTRYPGYYTTFSMIGLAGVTSTVRWVAGR